MFNGLFLPVFFDFLPMLCYSWEAIRRNIPLKSIMSVFCTDVPDRYSFLVNISGEHIRECIYYSKFAKDHFFYSVLLLCICNKYKIDLEE